MFVRATRATEIIGLTLHSSPTGTTTPPLATFSTMLTSSLTSLEGLWGWRPRPILGGKIIVSRRLRQVIAVPPSHSQVPLRYIPPLASASNTATVSLSQSATVVFRSRLRRYKSRHPRDSWPIGQRPDRAALKQGHSRVCGAQYLQARDRGYLTQSTYLTAAGYQFDQMYLSLILVLSQPRSTSRDTQYFYFQGQHRHRQRRLRPPPRRQGSRIGPRSVRGEPRRAQPSRRGAGGHGERRHDTPDMALRGLRQEIGNLQ